MRRYYPTMACLLQLIIGGCVDYLKAEEDVVLNNSLNFPPLIDTKHLSPQPLSLSNDISVGKSCKGQTFKVPPIEDRNKTDRLYYLWFLDNLLVWPQSTIEPEFRDSGIITMTIDEQFLLSHFETKLPKDFFGRPHVIEFFVSDQPYTIPESRYIDETKSNEKEHTDYVYWIVSFSNDPC